MRKRSLLILFLLGLAAAAGTAFLQSTPGYMDAYYYYYGGERLASGQGLTEMFLWNFLDSPEGLPHAAFSYWMPLTSFVAALGIKLFSAVVGAFRGAQLGFILIAACIPVLTASLAWEFSRETRFAWLSGILAVFMGYYQPFIAAIDGFGIYMLFGGLFFLVVLKQWRYKYLLLGMLAGGMHLTRADGILWLGMTGLAVLVDRYHQRRSESDGVFINKKLIVNLLVGASGYLLIMTPWLIRNFLEFGSPLSPGASRTLWLLDYDELFEFSVEKLNFSRWWAAGFLELLRVRYDALILNLESTFASLGMIFPGVIAILGIFRMRRHQLVQLGWMYWLVLVLVMTVAFPFAGTRGGFFHSGAALSPLIWVLVPHGVEVLTGWSVRVFNWQTRKIRPFYIVMLVVYVVIFSLGMVYTNVIGSDLAEGLLWSQTQRQYTAVEAYLKSIDADPEAIIISAMPPAYTSLTGRPSITIPDGGIEPLLAVIDRYQAEYVLIEENHPDEIEELFLTPADTQGLVYLSTLEGIHLFIWEGQ